MKHPRPVRHPRRRALRALGLAAILVSGFFAYRVNQREPSPIPSVPRPPPPSALTVLPVPVAPAPPPALPVAEMDSEEVRQMRRQLADLDSAVKKLATAPPPSIGTPLSSFRPVDPLQARTEKMLEQARADAGAGRWVDADRQLANIQIIDSDFLEAYVQRAALMEKRGMIKKAIEQWTEVVGRSVGSPLYDRAVAERIRLGALDRELPGDGPALRIVQAEVQRFPQSDEYVEMRQLSVQVQPVSAAPVDAAAVRLEATFFVRSGEGAEPVAVTTLVARLEGEWSSGQQRTLATSYLVPKGASPRGEFCGFVIGVYYRDRLQASDARPRALLAAGSAARGEML